MHPGYYVRKKQQQETDSGYRLAYIQDYPNLAYV
jgi:hypothetical protein